MDLPADIFSNESFSEDIFFNLHGSEVNTFIFNMQILFLGLPIYLDPYVSHILEDTAGSRQVCIRYRFGAYVQGHPAVFVSVRTILSDAVEGNLLSLLLCVLSIG